MAAIGLDFGSSNTTISWINPLTNKPEAVYFNGDASVKIPSAILGTQGGFLTGYVAQDYANEAYTQPDNIRIPILSNYVVGLKRKLNANDAELICDNLYSHTELLSIFFQEILSQAQEHCGSNYPIDSVYFTHPVDFEDYKVQIISNSLNAVGLRVLGHSYEPIAAAKGYSVNHKINDGDGILIFDFGGGTIDVSYVLRNGNTFDIPVQPKGSSKCGGQDIDMAIYLFFRNKILRELDYDISSGGQINHSIMLSCRKLKESFSSEIRFSQTQSALFLNGNFLLYKLSLSRGEFDNLVSSVVNEAVQVAQDVISSVVSKSLSISRVLLIGGSSKILLVQSELQKIANAPIEICGEKDIAVALGALIQDIDETEKKEVDGNPAISDDHDEFDYNGHIKCRNCSSENCFEYRNDRGKYKCTDCGWEGRRVKVIRD